MKKLFIVIAILCWSTLQVKAQTYSFNKFSDTYNALVSPVPISTTTPWSSFQSFTVPIGFNFDFMGSSFSTIHVEGSGFTNFDLAYLYLINPFTVELVDKGSVTSLSPITYEVTGSSPNQILKIDWSNCGFANDPSSTANFQLWLYEGTNTIEIRIGACNVVNPSSAYSGNLNDGPVCGIFNFDDATTYGYAVKGTTPAENAVMVSPIGNLFDQSMTGTPPSGIVYQFIPFSAAGINEMNSDKISMYPNPVSDQLFLNLPASISGYEIQILDAHGKICAAVQNSNRLNTAQLPAGFYLVKLIANEAVWTGKCLKF